MSRCSYLKDLKRQQAGGCSWGEASRGRAEVGQPYACGFKLGLPLGLVHLLEYVLEPAVWTQTRNEQVEGGPVEICEARPEFLKLQEPWAGYEYVSTSHRISSIWYFLCSDKVATSSGKQCSWMPQQRSEWTVSEFVTRREPGGQILILSESIKYWKKKWTESAPRQCCTLTKLLLLRRWNWKLQAQPPPLSPLKEKKKKKSRHAWDPIPVWKMEPEISNKGKAIPNTNFSFPGPLITASVARYWSPKACLPMHMGLVHPKETKKEMNNSTMETFKIRKMSWAFSDTWNKTRNIFADDRFPEHRTYDKYTKWGWYAARVITV